MALLMDMESARVICVTESAIPGTEIREKSGTEEAKETGSVTGREKESAAGKASETRTATWKCSTLMMSLCVRLQGQTMHGMIRGSHLQNMDEERGKEKDPVNGTGTGMSVAIGKGTKKEIM